MNSRTTAAAPSAAPEGVSAPLRHNVRLDRIEYRPIASLHNYERRLRKRSAAGLASLANSIVAFGFVAPILIDASSTIIAGEGLVEAAQSLGYHEVPTLRVDHLDAGEVRLLRLALNKLAESSEWDTIELAAEFNELLSLDLSLDYEVSGFGTIEVDNLVHRTSVEEEVDDGIAAVGDPADAVTCLGDQWAMGDHRVLCGSSLESDNLLIVMGRHKARMVLTDHPFNVRIANNVSGLGKVKHREFAQASGEMSEEEFTAFLTSSISKLTACCTEGALLYMYMDWRHTHEMTSAIRNTGLHLINLAVWIKSAPSMGSFYRSQYELCFITKTGKAPHRNNVMLGKYGRSRSNCWFYPGMNTFSAERAELLTMHPTSKNTAMLADAIRDATHRGEIVLDGFLGSGSTLIAAERTGRVCHGIELDPLYVDVIARRFKKETGISATLVATGQSFDAVADERRAARAAVEGARPTAPIRRADIVARPRTRIRASL